MRKSVSTYPWWTWNWNLCPSVFLLLYIHTSLLLQNSRKVLSCEHWFAVVWMVTKCWVLYKITFYFRVSQKRYGLFAQVCYSGITYKCWTIGDMFVVEWKILHTRFLFYFFARYQVSIVLGKKIKTTSQLNKFSKEMNVLILCFISQFLLTNRRTAKQMYDVSI